MSDSDSPLHAAEWFGALWTYTFKRRNRTFKEIYSQENRFKNQLIGYILQIVMLSLFLWIVITSWL